MDDFSKKLLADFPEFFKAQKNVIECNEGWYGLVYTLMQKLKRVAYKDGKQVISFEVDQVKEKFGGLRFYVSLTTDCTGDYTMYELYKDRVYALIIEAESLSCWICERCGSTMDVTTAANAGQVWIKTLCDKCRCAKCRTPTAP